MSRPRAPHSSALSVVEIKAVHLIRSPVVKLLGPKLLLYCDVASHYFTIKRRFGEFRKNIESGALVLFIFKQFHMHCHAANEYFKRTK